MYSTTMFTVAHHYCPLQSPAGLFRGLHKPSGRRRRNENSAAGGAKFVPAEHFFPKHVIKCRHNRKIPPLICAARPAPPARRRRPLSCSALREPSATKRLMPSPRLVSLRHSGSPAVCLRGSRHCFAMYGTSSTSHLRRLPLRALKSFGAFAVLRRRRSRYAARETGASDGQRPGRASFPSLVAGPAVSSRLCG